MFQRLLQFSVEFSLVFTNCHYFVEFFPHQLGLFGFPKRQLVPTEKAKFFPLFSNFQGKELV